VPDQSAVAAMTEAEQRESFFYKPVAQRAAVVAAGPIANFLLAIVIFAGVFALYGKQITSARVDTIQPASAAAEAGFQTGDLILSINGRGIESFSDMQRIVSTSAGQRLEFVIERGGARQTLQAVPALKEVKDSFGNVHRMGVLGITRSMAPGDVKTQQIGPLRAVGMGVEETWFVIERTMSYIAGIVVGRESADQLGGPIRIAQVSGQVATAGFVALMHLAAVLSVSIGLLNLFPIPLLDGGHLLFYAIEAARGRPLSERAQELGFRIGLAIVLMLMIFATFNDIVHLATS
jgi:regulator of sigma E protease